ncbi:Cation/H(+) antiporter 24 [Linum perenne]
MVRRHPLLLPPFLLACLGFAWFFSISMVRMEPADTGSGLSFSIIGNFGHSHGHHVSKVQVVSRAAAAAAGNGSAPPVVVPQIPIICHKTGPLPTGMFNADDIMHFPFKVVLLQAVVIIVLTRIVRCILKPLNQPKVVSDIIGGIIMGPSVLGRSEKFAAIFMPPNAQFVAKNLGIMGFMFFLFLSGVKMDMSVIKKSTKKEWLLSVIGMVIPIVVLCIVSAIIRPTMDPELSKVSSIGAIIGLVSISAFYVIHPILEEMNMLSSEIGRMALSTSIIIDTIGIFFMVAFEVMRHAESSARAAMWYNVSVVVLMVFIGTTLRRLVQWIIDQHQVGQPIKQMYIVALLLGSLIVAFLCDMFGIGIANGSFWLGLVIPDGPPLGSTIVDRSETFILHMFMPFSYILIGMLVDVFSIVAIPWSSLSPFFIITMTGFVSRFLANMIATVVMEMSFKERVSLSLMLCLRGQMEYIIGVMWLDKGIIGIPSFSMFVLLSTASTVIVTPIFRSLYDPTRPYVISKWRTIQHTPPNSDLKLLLCINDHETLSGLLNLLEFTFPTQNSPFTIYAIHIIEMIGRAAPIFVDHEQQKLPTKYASSYSIHNSLKFYQESKGDLVQLYSYTAIVPKRSMYQDVCEMALTRKSTLVLIPFHRKWVETMPDSNTKTLTSTILSKIIDHVPCSVGVLVQKGEFNNPMFAINDAYATHHFILLFTGGSDAREALAYSDRMMANPCVNMAVIRFLAVDNRGDDEMERKQDDGMLQWFMARNEATRRVAYKEVEVHNGEETLAAIHALKNMEYEMWIIGRERGINPVLLEGLANWSTHEELGVIGDYVSSSDFGTDSSVLIVQQQILRGAERKKLRLRSLSLNNYF